MRSLPICPALNLARLGWLEVLWRHGIQADDSGLGAAKNCGAEGAKQPDLT